jgi:hypothetical protein
MAAIASCIPLLPPRALQPHAARSAAQRRRARRTAASRLVARLAMELRSRSPWCDRRCDLAAGGASARRCLLLHPPPRPPPPITPSSSPPFTMANSSPSFTTVRSSAPIPGDGTRLSSAPRRRWPRGPPPLRPWRCGPPLLSGNGGRATLLRSRPWRRGGDDDGTRAHEWHGGACRMARPRH